jgi:hypothetical protein
LSNYTLAYQILTKIKSGAFGEEVRQNLDAQCYHMVLASCNEPARAKEIVREMRLSRRYRVGVIPPSKVTFTRAITVCRKARDVASARFFLTSARNDGIEVDAIMYSAGTFCDVLHHALSA